MTAWFAWWRSKNKNRPTETHSICRINYILNVALSGLAVRACGAKISICHRSIVWRSSIVSASALSICICLSVHHFGALHSPNHSTENKEIKPTIPSTCENYLSWRILLAHELIVSRLMFVPSPVGRYSVCFRHFSFSSLFLASAASQSASLWTIIDLSPRFVERKSTKRCAKNKCKQHGIVRMCQNQWVSSKGI